MGTMIAVWIVSAVVMAETPVCVCLDGCTIAGAYRCVKYLISYRQNHAAPIPSPYRVGVWYTHKRRGYPTATPRPIRYTRATHTIAPAHGRDGLPDTICAAYRGGGRSITSCHRYTPPGPPPLVPLSLMSPATDKVNAMSTTSSHIITYTSGYCYFVLAI